MSSTTDPPEFTTDLQRFLDHYYRDEIGELARAYPNDQHALTIDYADLFQFDPDVADDFGRSPETLRDYLEEALAAYELPVDVDLSDAIVRVTNAPAARTYDVGEYRSDRLTGWIAVEGQVSKQTAVQPLPEVVTYNCQRCGVRTEVPQSALDELQEPQECVGCERNSPFRIDQAATEWTDVQLDRVELPPERARGQSTAQLDVYLRDEIVDSADAGDRVTVTGRLTVDTSADTTIGVTPYLEADTVTVDETDYQDIDTDAYLEQVRAHARGDHGDPYQLLVDSIAPTIEGMETVKEALVLQLFGGVRAEYPDDTTGRGEPHVLLLCDPGTAKSSLLEGIVQKAPRSTHASAKEVTAAGLTAAAVADDSGPNKHSLDAGALILAADGIAAVDELDNLSDGAVVSLHEAVSTQRVHVSEAGSKILSRREALLAAGNPKHSRLVDEQPVNEPDQAIADTTLTV